MTGPVAGANRDALGPVALFACSFPGGTGFAWTFIEQMISEAVPVLAAYGWRVRTAYPSSIAEAGAPDPVALDLTNRTLIGTIAAARWMRCHNVRLLVLIDQSVRDWRYAVFRCFGVHRIVLYDHTSGERPIPHGLRRWGKIALSRLQWFAVDVIVGVSRFVLERHRRCSMVREDRLTLLHNGVNVPEQSDTVFDAQWLGVPLGTPVIACAARATPAKGVQVLLQALARIADATSADSEMPVLVFAGDGHFLPELKAEAHRLGVASSVFFLGYRSDVLEILRSADVCVVPSIWEEAFCLAAAEAMALGKVVVASSGGAIPEVVGDAGLLVPPGDASALAVAIQQVLAMETSARERLGSYARSRIIANFDKSQKGDELARMLLGIVDPASGLGPRLP